MYFTFMKQVLLLVIVLISLQAKEVSSPLSLQSAIITYDLSGGGILTPENNLTFLGTEQFYMKEEGKVKLNSLNLTERVDGSIKDFSEIVHMTKKVSDTIYRVDFLQGIIIKSKNENLEKSYTLENLDHNGTLQIANHTCELWKNKHQKICLYLDIPLLIEKEYLGFIYTKKAKFARFDFNISDEVFELPDLPVEKNTLIQNPIKTTQLHDTSYLYEKIIDGVESNGTKGSFYHFTDILVEKQKKKLPLMLEYMKEARVCISLAETKNSANACMYDLSNLITTMIQSSDLNIDIWTKEKKEKILDYLEEHILKLQVYIPCIKRVQNIDDLAMCMDK